MEESVSSKLDKKANKASIPTKASDGYSIQIKKEMEILNKTSKGVVGYPLHQVKPPKNDDINKKL